MQSNHHNGLLSMKELLPVQIFLKKHLLNDKMASWIIEYQTETNQKDVNI